MITLDKVMPNGALAKYHKIDRFEITNDFTCATVNSYHSDDLQIISWQEVYTIPLDFKIKSIEDIEHIMVLEGAPFAGGALASNEEVTLAAKKLIAWNSIKAKRHELINAGVTVEPYGTFDSDETSRGNISAAVLSAFMAVSTNQPFEITWTLMNNDTIQLDGPQMIEVGQAVMMHIDQCHEAARTIRAAIDACENIEEVEQLNVGEGWPV